MNTGVSKYSEGSLSMQQKFGGHHFFVMDELSKKNRQAYLQIYLMQKMGLSYQSASAGLAQSSWLNNWRG